MEILKTQPEKWFTIKELSSKTGSGENAVTASIRKLSASGDILVKRKNVTSRTTIVKDNTKS